MTLRRAAGRIRRFALLGGLAACSLLGTSGCREDDPPATQGETAAAAKDYERGPHAGRLLSDGEFQVEITIYERGVPPQFRVYLYERSKPLPPAAATLRIELHRLGGRVDSFAFAPEGDYLVGDGIVEEPHSFDVAVSTEHRGTTHGWRYSQSEGRVQLSDEEVRTSAIRIETAGPARLRSVLDLPGEISLNATR